MWDLVFFMIPLAVFVLIIHYLNEPEKKFEHINRIKGSDKRIEALENEINMLKVRIGSIEKMSIG